MSTLLAVDPGIRGSGCALFQDSKLIACAYVKGEKAGSGPAECAFMARAIVDWAWVNGRTYQLALVVEWPRVYQRAAGKSKGDPNDLRALCGVGGALAALLTAKPAVCVEPATWKGQVTKDAVAGRVWSRIDDAEGRVLTAGCKSVAKSLGHNIVDSVGIGLWQLGRFSRERVISRD